jgi:signal transduction histidine kinase
MTKTTNPKIILILRFCFFLTAFITPLLVQFDASAQSKAELGLLLLSHHTAEIYKDHSQVRSMNQSIRGIMGFITTSNSSAIDGENLQADNWYTSWWAYLFFLLILGFVIFMVDKYQRSRLLSKVHAENREKELIHAKEIQKAYNELKATQAQLVQQEKLASLGQLTAGIAHEIKNPLNFVNNFSELSLEYIEEIFVELDKLEQSEITAEMRALLEDIKYNLQKTLQHGSRADGIVKSMLMHSRGGKGIMEPTDLNGLVKEYVNLAFHGMRANKNPINVDIQLQLDENLPTANINPEDFSRVILNLCKNAFDAMRDKTKENQNGYLPKLTVRTKDSDDKILVEVEDNGPGIAEENRDKLLMPFFTTKKGNEGTGLGLSITHDIVKAHQGVLEINSIEGEFTKFSILLPKEIKKDQNENTYSR